MLKLGTLATAKTVASLCERSSIIDRTYERVFFTTRDNAINGINRWKRSIRTYFNYYYQNEGHISLSKHGLNLALFHLWNQSKALYIYIESERCWMSHGISVQHCTYFVKWMLKKCKMFKWENGYQNKTMKKPSSLDTYPLK